MQNRFSMQCDPVSMEHDEKSSVLTNKNITMINTVLIYRAKNTKLYRVSNVQRKVTNTLPHVSIVLACALYEYTHDRRVVSESWKRVATMPCACVHLSDCFPIEGHILKIYFQIHFLLMKCLRTLWYQVNYRACPLPFL